MDVLHAAQELQNSILDQTRRLQEAADDKATHQTVQRQMRAELARAQGDAAATREEAAQKGREVASLSTVLKVISPIFSSVQGSLKILNRLKICIEIRCWPGDHSPYLHISRWGQVPQLCSRCLC